MTLDSTFVVFNLTSRMCPCTRPHGHASLHKSLSWAPAEDLGLFPPLPSSKQGPASPLPRSATPPLFARLKPPQPPPQKRRRSPHRLHRGLHHLDLVLLVVGLLLHILTHDPVLRKVAPVHRLLEPRRLGKRKITGDYRRLPEMTRDGETWGDMGRYEEVRGDTGRCACLSVPSPLASSYSSYVASECASILM